MIFYHYLTSFIYSPAIHIENMNISIGETNLEKSNGYSEIRKAKRIVFHPMQSKDKAYDTALIQACELLNK